MPLSLNVQAYRGTAPLPPMGRRFDRTGGVVGRGAGSDLLLDDPTKYISRAHARVEFRDGGWFLVDIGSNPSLINGQALGPAGPARLTGGERIDIGDYTLVATLEPEPPQWPPGPAPLDRGHDLTMMPPPGAPMAPMASMPPAGPAAAMPSYERADDSLAGASIMNVGGAFAAGFDPAFDPLGLNLGAPAERSPGPGYRGAESDHAPPEQAAFVMPRAAVVPSRAIPDDYDPLADLMPAPLQAAPQPLPRPAPPPTMEPVRAPVSEPEPDPMSAPDSEPEPKRAPAPELQPASQVRPGLQPAPAAAAAPAAMPVPVRADDNRVVQALLRGMGLKDLHSRHDPEELAELAGAMLREATAGTIGALMARTLTKRESRVEMTMIAPQANNPLKFFPDAATALTHMLQGPLPGYLAPQKAYAGAFVDLRAHELAVMAGTRAALAGVLRRFDPEAIEARLQEPGMLEKVFTGSRKTRMWDQLVALYGQLALEADEDFQRLFGEAFAVAYEEQVRRLREVGH